MKLTNRELINAQIISNYTGYDIDTVRDVLRGLAYLANLAIYDETNEKNEVIIPFIGQIFFNISEVLKNGEKHFVTSPEIYLSKFIEEEIDKIKRGINSNVKDYHLKNINEIFSMKMGITDNISETF